LATPAASVRIYQSALITLPPASPIRRAPSAAALALGVAVVGAGAALAITNPSMADYEHHAGAQLVTLATEELCDRKGLPMVLRLWIQDCPQLIADQRTSLAALAGRFTRRRTFGLFSVFTIKVGGQDLLPSLRLPAYTVTTVGIAGHFITVQTRADTGKLE